MSVTSIRRAVWQAAQRAAQAAQADRIDYQLFPEEEVALNRLNKIAKDKGDGNKG